MSENNKKTGVDFGLTSKQALFAEEYIVDLNATQAVARAMYNTKAPNKMSAELLRHPKIKAYIDYLLVERGKKTVVKPDYVLKKIMRTIEKAESQEKPDHNAVLRGCELLAKHLGMFVERTEITGKDGEAIKYEKISQDAADFTSEIIRLAQRSGTKGTSEPTQH